METAFNTRDLIEEDAAYQEVVSKLRVKDDVVSVIKLNPPYNLLVDLGEISSGRGERTQTFDLSVPNRARYQLRHTPKYRILILYLYSTMLALCRLDRPATI